MLNLGHINYSNCIPVHGRFLMEGPPPGVRLVRGTPGELNLRLALGEIDVAPASCIEYPRHLDRYRLIPGLSISARGRVRTIQLIGRRPLEEWRDGIRLALPTASATAVALVKIITSQQLGITPHYSWFAQEEGRGVPSAHDAALYIGDDALRQLALPEICCYDLGALWHEWTGLPFVFALWQIGVGRDRDDELRSLVGEIEASRDWSLERLPILARELAADYGWGPDGLLDYWRSLSYGWDSELASGLAEFYRRAAEIGEIPVTAEPRFLEL